MLLLALTILLSFGLPKATIVITPAAELKSVSQEITVSTHLKDPDFVHHKLPALVITKELSDKVTVKREANNSFADYATGKVTLYNNQDQEQQLLPRTHLRHVDSVVFFLTNTGVAIPPHGEISVTVTAVEKGASGNVAPGQWVVDRLPPYLQDKIYGVSSQTFSGGITVAQSLHEKEINKSQDNLITSIQERLRGQLTAQASGAYLPDNLVSFNIKRKDTSALPGSKTNEYEVSAQVVGHAFLVDENDLLGLTLLNLRSSADPEQVFVQYDPQSFKTTVIKRDAKRGEAIIESSLSGIFVTKIAPTVFTGNDIAGLSSAEIKDKLTQLPGVGQVKVKFFPFWVSAAPSRANAIDIKIANTDPTAYY